MEFNFVTDPQAYKKELRLINKNVAAAEAAGKPITNPKQLKPQPREIISASSMEKPNVSLNQFQKLINILMKNYREEKFASNQEAVRDFVQSNSLTTRQAVEVLRFFKDTGVY